MYAGDLERAATFYSLAFGWTARPVEKAATAGETFDGQLLVSSLGRVVGAVVPRPASSAAPAPDALGCVVYLPVDDVAEAMAAVVDAGGAEVSPPRHLTPFGTLAVVRDTEGNLIGLYSRGR